jgi:hypothetical protein
LNIRQRRNLYLNQRVIRLARGLLFLKRDKPKQEFVTGGADEDPEAWTEKKAGCATARSTTPEGVINQEENNS